MGSDFIPDPQGVHQHSLEWPGGAYAPMHPPVSAPAGAWDVGAVFENLKKRYLELIYWVENG